jgi:hypothetical protein
MRAVAPEWVLESLNEMNSDMKIGFEEDSISEEQDISDVIEEVEIKQTGEHESTPEENDDEVQFIGGHEQQQVVLQFIKEAEDAWKNMAVKDEMIKDEEDQEESKVQTEEEEEELTPEVQSGHYVTRFERVSRPPVRLMESTYAVIKETYHQNFYEGCGNKAKDTVECTNSMKKALLFDKAVVAIPEEAIKALREEVIKAIKINIWHPVHLKDLSNEEKELIIPQMINYLEKYKPDATFDKFKVRVLARGDKQIYTGESDGPVARIETLLMLLVIAIYNDFVIFKVDFGSAFMRTPISEDVKHKWVKLNKRGVKLLLELEYDKYKDYVLQDGSVIAEMDKLSYGYVEVAHYWYETLAETFTSNGKDKYLFIKKDENNVAICGYCG